MKHVDAFLSRMRKPPVFVFALSVCVAVLAAACNNNKESSDDTYAVVQAATLTFNEANPSYNRIQVLSNGVWEVYWEPATAEVSVVPASGIGDGSFYVADMPVGETVQIAYGMDQQYKCELEVWGSLATLHSGRILTAPAGFVPSATIECGSEKSTRTLPADDTFLKSLLFFEECTKDPSARERGYRSAISQAELVDSFRAAAGMPLGEDV